MGIPALTERKGRTLREDIRKDILLRYVPPRP